MDGLLGVRVLPGRDPEQVCQACHEYGLVRGADQFRELRGLLGSKVPGKKRPPTIRKASRGDKRSPNSEPEAHREHSREETQACGEPSISRVTGLLGLPGKRLLILGGVRPRRTAFELPTGLTYDVSQIHSL